MSSYKKAVSVGVAITVIGTIAVLFHWRQISGRQGTIIIPAGNTYLGPTTPAPQPAAPSTFTVTDDTIWHTVKGHSYPYTMSAPETLSLVTFPNDPYDMYAIAWKDSPPDSNILISVDDLSKNTTRSQFINQSKTVYISQWWKQFGSLKGISSIEPFTNSTGLKGYTVKFLNAANESPNVDIFFEVPGLPQYVIHLTNGILDPAVFTKIVDSVGWEVR